MLFGAPRLRSVAVMTEERQEAKRVRLFVALDLPGRVCQRLARWGERELADEALRAVLPTQLHVTLAFLGHRPVEQVEPIAAAVRACAGPAPQMELSDPVGRPAGRRPRLFALPVRSEGAESLQEALTARLVEAELYEPETRPFWPHVTLARVRGEGRGSKRPMAVSRPPGELPQGLREPFFGVRVALYRSELQPRGARYVPLAQVELPARGRQ